MKADLGCHIIRNIFVLSPAQFRGFKGTMVICFERRDLASMAVIHPPTWVLRSGNNAQRVPCSKREYERKLLILCMVNALIAYVKKRLFFLSHSKVHKMLFLYKNQAI